MSLTRSVLRGAAWSGSSSVVTSASAFLVKLILARLLVPEHFGLVGMAVVFTSIVQVFGELGLAGALVQKQEDQLKEEHLQSAFWASVGLGVGLYLFTALALGPFIAWFYQQPILRPVVAVIALSLVVKPASLIPRILFTRALDFRRLAAAEILSVAAASVIVITLALRGGGVWSVALQAPLQAAFLAPIAWWLSSWRPAAMFSIAALRDILPFGAYLTASSILVAVTAQLDYLLIGRWLGAELLGIYTLAFLLTDTIRKHMLAVMNKVMYPVYGKLQKDPAQVASYYLGAVRYNTLVLFPVMWVFVLFAGALVPTVFGPAWEDAVLPLRILAIATMVHTVGGTSASLLRGIGRADLAFRIGLTRTLLVTIPALVVGIHFFGVIGAAWAVVIHKAAARMGYQYHLRALVGISELDVGKALGPAAVATAAGLVAAGLLAAAGFGGLMGALGFLTFYSAASYPVIRRTIRHLAAPSPSSLA